MSLLAASGVKGEIVRVVDHYHDAANMTDSIAALAVLSSLDGPAAGPAFAHFYERWKDDHVVIDKWFALQAQSPRMGDAEGVRRLMGHPLFSLENPNKVRAVLGVFAQGNQLRFNADDGRGYDLVVELGALHRQVQSDDGGAADVRVRESAHSGAEAAGPGAQRRRARRAGGRSVSGHL